VDFVELAQNLYMLARRLARPLLHPSLPRLLSSAPSSTPGPPSAEQPRPATPSTSSVIFFTPESRLVRLLAWTLAAQAGGATGLAAWWTWEEYGKLQRLVSAAEASGRDFGAFVSTTELPLPWFSPGAGLALLAYLGWWQVRRGTRRVVRKMVREVDAEGREWVHIEGMGALWGTWAVRKEREAVECASANRLVTHFMTVPEGAWFLLPVPGWYSEDLAYLKTLLWWRYFRDDPVPKVPDSARIAIEGFGPFRPAALADPYHPAHAAMPFPAKQEHLEGTRLVAGADGNVYATFPADHRASLEERRADARAPLLDPQDAQKTPDGTSHADGDILPSEQAVHRLAAGGRVERSVEGGKVKATVKI
jgi:hypothetical protein